LDWVPVDRVQTEKLHRYVPETGLWLAVKADGITGGCQVMSPVPYALGLQPGARIAGDVRDGPSFCVPNDFGGATAAIE